MLKEKLASVKAAMQDIEKQFGRGAIMMLGGQGQALNEPIAVTPSGSVALDQALGVGGLPRGRVVEMFGPESSGKTTMALHAIASVQQAGGVAAFVDAEHALDPRYARALGIDVDQLLISQPDNGEQALEIVETLVRSGAIDIVVVDSVAALVPKAELEGEMGDAHVGLQARLMSQAMRKLTGFTSRTRTTLVFINQTRHKIGVMFGNPETTTGGNALKFYCSVRLDIRRIGGVKDGDAVIGNRVRVRVVKNKVAPPFREAEIEILYGRGISSEGELLDLGTQAGLVEKAGAWYAMAGERMGQGRERAREWLAERPALMAKMRQTLLSDAPSLDALGSPQDWQPTAAPAVSGGAALQPTPKAEAEAGAEAEAEAKTKSAADKRSRGKRAA